MSKEPQISRYSIAHDSASLYQSSPGSPNSRGSKKKVSHFLVSLQNLQNLKVNPNLHSLSYSELAQLKASTPITAGLTHIKPRKVKVVKKIQKEEYISLDPSFLRENTPQRPRRLHFPSQKRQLFMDQYSDHTKNAKIRGSPRRFETIWHQTLSSKSGLDISNSIEKDDNKRNSVLQTPGSLNMYVTGGLFPRNFADTSNIKVQSEGISIPSSENKTPVKAESLPEERKTITEEESSVKAMYHNVRKELKIIEDIQKDFNKIVSHVQKSYHKAEGQQNRLHDFALVFATEIAELEKFPKETKLNRLTHCLKSVNHKIEELQEQEDLIKEQILYISELLASSQAANQPDQGTLDQIVKQEQFFTPKVTSTFKPSRSVGLKMGKSMQDTNQNCEIDPEEPKSKTTSEVFTQAIVKAQKLKIDVKRLQYERQKYFIALKRERATSAQKKGFRSSSFLKKWCNQSDIQDADEKPDEVKVPKRPQSSLRVGGLRKQDIISQKEKEVGFSFDIPSTRSQEVMTTPKMVSFAKNLREVDCGVGEQRDVINWTSVTELYNMLTVLTENLDETLKKEFGQMKALKKDVDEERSSNSVDPEIYAQIKKCYENILQQIHQSLPSFLRKRTQFLNDVASHFVGLEELNKSNLLKVESLKNLIEASIKKVIGIEKFSRKYNHLDLEDKMIRQKYAQKYEKLKLGLIETHKTLHFIAEQFQFSMEVYKLQPITQLNDQDLLVIKTHFETVSKILYYLHVLPDLEQEYNDKTWNAYNAVKKAKRAMDSIEQSFKEEKIGAKKIREWEEPIGVLKTLNVKIIALRNKLEAMSKVKILDGFVAKPLLVTVKLLKQIDMNEKKIEQLLSKLQEKITLDYNNLMSGCEEVEKQVTTHTKRLISSNEHLASAEWSQNYQIMATLKTEIRTLEDKVSQYIKEDYPLRVPLLPRPQQKKEALCLIEKRVEVVMKTLARGSLLTYDNFYRRFEDIHSSNLKENIETLYDDIVREIQEQETIIGELDKEAVSIKKIANDVLQFLKQLRTILKKAFDLQDSIAQEYLGFVPECFDENDNPYLRSIRIPEVEAGSIGSVEGSSKAMFEQTPTDQNPSINNIKASITTVGVKTNARSVATFTLPALDNPGETLKKIDTFIMRVRNLFKEYIENQLAPRKEEHVVYREIYSRFQNMYSKEGNTLERVRAAVSGAQTNHIFFLENAKPLTKLYRCVDLMPMWNEKMETLLIAKHNMIETLAIIKSLEGDTAVRGGIELQIKWHKNTQKVVSSSMDMITEILSFGRIFNEKEVRPHLNTHFRGSEETNMEAYLTLLDRKVEKLMETYYTAEAYYEEDTATLTEKFSKFVKSFTALIRTTQNDYLKLSKKTGEDIKNFQGDSLKLIEDIYNTAKELTDTFCEGVNKIAQSTNKPTWVVKLLDDFYQEIILKDLHIFAELLANGKEIDEFLKEFKDNFIEVELKQRAQYRKVAESNPARCDSRVKKVTELAQRLNFLTYSQELMYRTQLKQFLVSKHKSLQMIKKVYSHIAMVYSMGRKLADQIESVLVKKEALTIPQGIPEVEKLLPDMIRHLEKIAVDCKDLIKGCNLDISFDLSQIIKEVLDFYIKLSAWLVKLKGNLLKIVNFYADLKKTFRGQVYLLRSDWLSFVKEWLSNSIIEINHALPPLPANYQDYKERLDGYLRGIQKSVTAQQNSLRSIVESVQYLNEKFFHEWFFDMSDARPSNDMILTKMMKLSEKIKNDRYQPVKLKEKVKKLCGVIETCDRSIRILSDEQNVTKIFEEGVKSWELVQQYYKNKSIRAWLSILLFVSNTMLLQEGNEKDKTQFKEKIQNIDGLYLAVEQAAKCPLNTPQKEFLVTLYQWVNRTYFG